MPESLRSLIVILSLSIAFFAFAARPASIIIGREHFTTRRNLWFGLTLVAFLANNFWIFVFIAIPLILYARQQETNLVSLFFFVLFALPVATIQIPGMGLINYFFELSPPRLLELFILLPAYIKLPRQSGFVSFGRTGPDKILAAYLLLIAAQHLHDTSLTNALRHLFYLFMDVFLPYMVISRSLKSLHEFKDALLSFVLAIMVLAPIAIFEAGKHWLLYSSLLKALHIHGITGYLGRAGMLRASATAGQPIALGYLMAVGVGFYLFLQRFIMRKYIRQLGVLLLAAGLISTLSRGPWVGAALLVVLFLATGTKPVKRLTMLAAATVIALSLTAILPVGDKIINLLPFLGTADKSTITYREDLLHNSIIVIKRNLWFGSVNYLETPEMEALRNGSEGIIDVVNSYLSITLKHGIVGLGLFISFFSLILLRIYKGMRSLKDRNSELYLLGRVLFATQLAILVIIFTVSSITFIPIVYWSVAGLGMAYVRMTEMKIIENGNEYGDIN